MDETDLVLVVVGVAVPLSVAECFRAGVVRVAQVQGHDPGLPRPHVGESRVDADVGSVRLRRGREVHHSLGERNPPLRHADQLHRLGRGDRERQRLRVGDTNVFSRRDDHASRDEARVLPRLDHPRQVVQGGVGVAAANRLDERADDVVVLVAGAVVAQEGPVDGGGDRFRRDYGMLVLLIDGRERCLRGRLERGQRAPGIPGRQTNERVARLVVERDATGEPARVDDGAVHEHPEVVVLERFQGEQEAAAEQRGDHREAGILCRRGDQHDPAVLDAGEQRILLGLRESVDLVEKQHGRRAVEVAVAEGALHDLAHVFDSGRDRRQFDEAAP